MTTATYYKVLRDDGACYHGGSGSWSLPHDGVPGDWMPKLTGELRPCQYGYHVLRRDDLVYWLGPRIYTVETQGPVIWDHHKGVCAEARLLQHLTAWNEKTARLFAADCAEAVLHLYEDQYPDDSRPRQAIEAARAYANDLITPQALATASDAASYAAMKTSSDAWAAAWTAAWAAAWDAAAAARDASTASRAAAARTSSGATAQTKLLFRYLEREE